MRWRTASAATAIPPGTDHVLPSTDATNVAGRGFRSDPMAGGEPAIHSSARSTPRMPDVAE
jgi:hypothetical protein